MADQIRDIYRVSSTKDVNSLSADLNRVLQRISDRMDQMEGFRGTPKYYTDTILTPSGVLSLKGTSWPVGSIFLSSVATNPATLLGYGTWSPYGAGKVLIGIDSTDDDFKTLGDTGEARPTSIRLMLGLLQQEHHQQQK